MGHQINDLRRHGAVSREFSPHDGNDARFALQDPVLAGHRAWILGFLRRNHRSYPGPRGHDIVRLESCLGKEGVGRSQQINDVVRRGPGQIRVDSIVGIGGPDIAELTPGNHEHDSAVKRRGEGHRFVVAEPPPGDGHVNATSATEDRRLVLLGPEVI